MSSQEKDQASNVDPKSQQAEKAPEVSKELSDKEIQELAGGLNPQPLPPGLKKS
jgi:hypothetical protein